MRLTGKGLAPAEVATLAECMSDAQDRVYFLDWLRVGALGLLILYHCELPYVAHDWVVRAPGQVDQVSWLFKFISEWQMALLFLVAGAALRFSVARDGPHGALRQRILRIGPPIVFGALLLTPLQQVAAAINHQDISRMAQGHAIFQHVWFLPFLLFYVALSSALFARAPRVSARLDALALRAVRGPMALGALIVILVVAAIAQLHTVRSYAIWSDVAGHIRYGGMFLLGFHAGAVLWERLTALRAPALGLLVAAAIAKIGIDGGAHMTANAVASAIFGAMTIAVLCGFGRLYLNRRSALLTRANRAVMPIYLFHQPIAALLVPGLAAAHWPVAAERIALVFATAAISYALYRLFDMTRLRALVGLGPPPRRQPAANLALHVPP